LTNGVFIKRLRLLHCLLILLVPIVCFSVTSSPVLPNSDDVSGDYTISLKVDLVTTDITVKGLVVPELKAEDFLIYDDNIAHQASSLSQDHLPLAVAILIDCSGSIQSYLNQLMIAAMSAMQRLKPEDQVALFALGGSFEKISDLTEDRLLIAKQISKIRIGGFYDLAGNEHLLGGGTDILGPLDQAARYLKQQAPRRRRAILLISDNGHNVGQHSLSETRIELLENAVTMFDIAISSGFGPLPGSMGDIAKEIGDLAEITGGEVINVNRSKSLKEALEDAILKLRMQYTLGFYPSDPTKKGKPHKLEVRFVDKNRCPDCKIIGRKSYRMDVSAPAPPSEPTQSKIALPSKEIEQLLIQRSVLIAGNSAQPMSQIPFKLRTIVQADPGSKSKVEIQMQIDANEIAWAKTGDWHEYKIIAAVIYKDEKGKMLDAKCWRLQDRLRNETYQQISREGIPFKTEIPALIPNQKLNFVVYDENSGKVGAKFIQIHNKETMK
jgi:Ca-activated chloride channel homolog